VHPSIHRSRVTSPPEPVTLADFPDPGFSKAGSCLGRRRDTAHRRVRRPPGRCCRRRARDAQSAPGPVAARSAAHSGDPRAPRCPPRSKPYRPRSRRARQARTTGHSPCGQWQRRGSDQPFTQAWPKFQAGTGTSSSCGYRTLTEHAEVGDAVKARAEPDRVAAGGP